MRDNLQRRGILSAFLSLLITALFVLGGLPASVIEASAATQRVRLVLPSNDLAQVPEIEVIDDERIISDELRGRIRNSSFNYNLDVTTGKHYEALNDTEKAFYRALVKASEYVYPNGGGPNSYTAAGCARIASGLDSELEVTAEEYNNALEAAKYDHIDLLQLTLCEARLSRRSTTYEATGTTVHEAYLFLACTENYQYSQATFDSMTNQLRSARASFLADPSITGAKGTLGKELAIHDKLLKVNTYDNNCLQSWSPFHIGHTAYGALVDGTSVCDGYAMAYAYLLEGVSIESMVVSGEIISGGTGGHAWNIVKQNGEWYEVDTTWDDQENTSFTESDREKVTHVYFHLTTAEISNHSYYVKLDAHRNISGSSKRARDGFSTRLPVAESTQYDYENTLKYLQGESSGIPVSLLQWDVSSMNLTEGDEGEFHAYVLPVDAENQSITWESSDTSMLTVDESGHYKALSAGECTVTATSVDGGYTARCTITIAEKQNVSGNTDPDPEPTQSNEEQSGTAEQAGKEDKAVNTTPDAGTQTESNQEPVNTPENGNIISGGNDYRIDNGGTATVTKEDNKKIKKVSIGDTVEYNGVTYRISVIESNAYKNCKKLVTVTIGANVEKIGAGAFNGCTNLKKITIKGNNLKTVGSGSFKKIKKGAKITIICKDKKIYNKLVKKIKKAGAKNAVFKFKKG